MNKKGFTLVEILAVVVLLSLLVVFATSSGFGAFDKTKKRIDATQVKSIEEGFKIFLTELKEDSCVDNVGSYTNPMFADADKILRDSGTPFANCEQVRNYIENELTNNGGTININIEKFLETGYVTGTSIDDIGDTGDFVLQITGEAILDPVTGNPTNTYKMYEEVEKSYVFNYDQYNGENDANNIVIYLKPSTGNDSNKGKTEDKPVKTIDGAQNKAGEKNLKIYLLENITLSNTLTPDKDMTISGITGNEVINFNNKTITSGSNQVTISNVTISNYSNDILSNENIKLKNVKIDPIDFAYKNGYYTYNANTPGEYKLEVWGAQGGTYLTSGTKYGEGGKGGYSVGTLTITNPTTLYIYIGQQPTGNSGGYNGGSKTNYYGRGGGGATDIRIGSTSLYARVIVAGGGGSNGWYSSYPGGYGGGENGGSGANGTYAGGGGGTQTAGGTSAKTGAAGTFGAGGYASTNGGGAGGGWYGGGHGISGGTDSSGGGGSGYIYTSATASNYPSGCLLNSTHYLKDAETIAGDQEFNSPTGNKETGHSGHGYARITITLNS